MTPQFLCAVIDTLIPGETSPGEAGLPALPSGSAAGLDLGPHAEAHRDVLRAIAERAGGEESFVAADETKRVAILQTIERERPDPFRALVVHLLQDYCETDLVLTAMGWRTDPPQPRGYAMMQSDMTIDAAVARVKQRAKIWRD
jgi:hypothetical protein